ncbi:MAG: hypothetical protein ACRDD1_06265, partial [Planctomycetia bacterium]
AMFGSLFNRTDVREKHLPADKPVIQAMRLFPEHMGTLTQLSHFLFTLDKRLVAITVRSLADRRRVQIMPDGRWKLVR